MMVILGDRLDFTYIRSASVVGVTLKRQYGDYTVAQLPVLSAIPSWCDGAGFVSVCRGGNELSVICLKDRVPARVPSEGELACFKLPSSRPSKGASLIGGGQPSAFPIILTFARGSEGTRYRSFSNR